MDATQSTIANNGWERSAEAWILQVERDKNRSLLLDQVMLDLCGDVQGQDVLDIGCGEGRFCRLLAARGARTVGIDPTPAFIAKARALQPESVFQQCRAEVLPLSDASVDLVVSYVTLLDIDGYREAIQEIARVLRPDGRCVVANLNGFATASKRFWARDEEGRKLHWTMDDYMIERLEPAEWAGISVRNWHRPLSAYLQAFMGAGLKLEHFDEPVPIDEIRASNPEMNDYLRVPHFCTMVWRK